MRKIILSRRGLKIPHRSAREKSAMLAPYEWAISYLNSDECASRKASLLSSSSITSMACLGTVISSTLFLNLSPTASLSSFSSPSSLLMILSCSCRRYFFCCLLTFSSTCNKEFGQVIGLGSRRKAEGGRIEGETREGSNKKGRRRAGKLKEVEGKQVYTKITTVESSETTAKRRKTQITQFSISRLSVWVSWLPVARDAQGHIC